MSCGSLCFCCAGSQRQRSASSSDERVDSSGDDKKQISGKKKSKSPFYSPAETAAAATSRTRQHDVSVKEFDHLICCQVCYQLIFGRALVCKGCPLLCHMKCELKVVTPCNGAVTSSTKKSPGETQALKSSSHKPQQLNGLGTYQSTATSSTERSTGSTKGFAAFFKMNNGNSLLRTGFGPKDPAGAEIEVMYITERMLVLTFPTGGLESVYRSNLKQVSRMLKTKHGDKYKIFNLSKRRHDLCKFNTNVAEFGWPEDLAPPLERLCGICKEIENWLSGDPHNIVVVHSKGGKSRPAVVIAAYMHYTNICASDDQALDRFAMRRFTDDYVGGIAQPSHRRYVMYFSGLLSGAIKINSSAIYLQHIAVLGLPTVDGKSCNPFVKIYEKMVPVHTSGVLYQFNTCALDFRPGKGANRLTFTKDDLDEACYDNRMPSYSRVEMLFSLSPNVLPNGIETVSSTSEMEPQMPRWDSYENFDSTPEDEELETSVSFSDQAEIGHKASETNDDQEECKDNSLRDLEVLEELYTATNMPARRSASATNARERDLLQLGDMSQYKPRHRAPAAPSATWDVLDDERVPTLPDLPLSRSVTSTPVHYGGRRQNRKDRFSFSSDMDPDEWLEAQLEKLRVKKENDPEILLRKEHERRLLDELKNIHEDRLVQRGKDEADYSVEGTIHINYGRFLVKCLRTCFGSKSVDPVEEWRREEERIKNTRSPLLAGAGGGSRSTPTSPYVPHRTATPVGKSFTHPAAERPQLLTRHSSDALHDRRGPPVMPLYLPGKPPTPPPRERSRTPPSPRRQSPVRNSSTLPSYEQAVNKRRPTTPPLEGFSAPAAPGGHVSRRDMSLPTSSSRTEVNFDNLESLLWDVESPLRPSGPENVKQERRNVSNSSPAGENLRQQGVVLVSQSPKSILKKPKSTGSAGSDFNRIESSPVHNGPIRGGVDNSVVPNGPIRGRGSSARSGGVRSPDPSPVVGEREFVVQKAQTLERSTGYTEVDVHASANRPETPAFPVRKTETPLPYHPLLYDGAEFDPRSPGQPRTPIGRYQETRPSTAPIIQARSPSPGSMYYGQSRRSSLTSLEPMEVIHHHPVFVKDTSKYWYKPTISREEAINVLKEKAPGTFIVRDSNSFPGAFGLALKVATPPPGVQAKSGDGTELVRHFLIEPSAKGVKLKGCNNEPVFGSLSALVYQHSITPLALPCKLILPEFDPAVSTLDHRQMSSAQALLEQGAACNVIYINSCDTESLTGPEAVRRVIDQAFNLLSRKQLVPTNVHFKVSAQGITVTDNTRKLFFRRHYPTNSVTFCGLDPDDRRWNHQAYETAGTTMAGNVLGQARIFGFVARKISSRTDNACHVFAEYEAEQPATAIVNFVTKVMMAPLQHQQNK